MAEGEPYGCEPQVQSQQQEKPSKLQLPGALDSRKPEAVANSRQPSSKINSSGGHYLNVAQKGKLILPTALWILLIIAGVSFLTLLASLNKSIGALDTLVELEQEKEARAALSERLHLSQRPAHWHLHGSDHKEPARKQGQNHKSHRREQQSLSNSIVERRWPQDLDFGDSWLPSPSVSWFALPSWTSLEPSHKAQSGASAPDTSATILVASSEPELGAGGPIDFLVRQMRPMIESLTGPGELISGEPAAHQAQDGKQDELQAPVISAQIDNVNLQIELSGADERAGEPEQDRQRLGTNRNKMNKRRKQQQFVDRGRADESESSLEKSIDELVGQLMEERHKHSAAHMGPMEELVARPLVINAPVDPLRIAPIAGHHKPSPPPPPPPHPVPFSPLANLLLGPIGFRPPPPPAPQKQPNEHVDELVINLSPDEPSLQSNSISVAGHKLAPSQETNRYQLSNTRRPSVSSAATEPPYEFQPAPDLLLYPFELFGGPSFQARPADPKLSHSNPGNSGTAHHHVTKAGPPGTAGKSGDGQQSAPWDLFANELADSLYHELKHQKLQQPGNNGAHQQDMPVLILDMEDLHGSRPSGQSEKQKGAEEKREKEGAPGELDEVINMFFGPQNEWAKQQQSAKTSIRVTDKPSADEPAGATTAPVPHSTSTGASLEPHSSLANSVGRTTESGSSSKSSPASEEIDRLISELPRGGPLSKEDERLIHQDAGDMLSSLVGHMFALPQMSGASESASTVSGVSMGEPSAAPSVLPDVTKSIITTPALPSADQPVGTSSSPASESPAATTMSSTTAAPIVTTKGISSILTTTIEPFHESSSQTVETLTSAAVPIRSAPSISMASAPIAEIIDDLEAISKLPVIDLAPFAKSTSPKPTLNEVSSTTKQTLAPLTSDHNTPSTNNTTTNKTSNPPGVTIETDSSTKQPEKTFLERADDFIERNFLSLKKVFQ